MEIEHVSSAGPTLILDGTSNAMDNLEMVEVFLEQGRPGRWKWASLAMCLALNGFGLVALGGTAPKLYLANLPKQRKVIMLSLVERMSDEEIAKETGYALEDVQEALANPQVIGVDKVLTRLDPGWLDWLDTIDADLASRLRDSAAKEPERPAMVKPLALTDEQRKSIWFLIKGIRNPFEHFMPHSWSILLTGMPKALLHMLDAIEQLIRQHGLLLIYGDELDTAIALCERVRQFLQAESKTLQLSPAKPILPPSPIASALPTAIARASDGVVKNNLVRQSRKTGPRLSPDEVTPRDAYRLPILSVLVEKGGRATRTQVLDGVYVRVRSLLTSADLKGLPSNKGQIRWKNKAEWCRREMVEEGLLSDVSPRGVWEITEAGRRWLESAALSGVWADGARDRDH